MSNKGIPAKADEGPEIGEVLGLAALLDRLVLHHALEGVLLLAAEGLIEVNGRSVAIPDLERLRRGA